MREQMINGGMEKGFLRTFGALTIAAILGFTHQSARGDANISWTYDEFSPSSVVVGLYEDVIFWNDDDFFDLRLTVEGYLPGYIPPGEGASVWFDSPGVYNFGSYSDSGYIVVNVPPSVEVTSPTNNAVFSAPATFDIQVSASDTGDDLISEVEFFLASNGNTNSLGFDYDVPFSASVTNLAGGNYVLIAVATDSRGWSDTHAIAITVNSAPTVINLGALRISGNQVLFDVTGLTVGKTNVLQTSSNLTAWTPIKTNTATAPSATITNGITAGPHYYRVLQR